jgi:hypothetical protein
MVPTCINKICKENLDGLRLANLSAMRNRHCRMISFSPSSTTSDFLTCGLKCEQKETCRLEREPENSSFPTNLDRLVHLVARPPGNLNHHIITSSHASCHPSNLNHLIVSSSQVSHRGYFKNSCCSPRSAASPTSCSINVHHTASRLRPSAMCNNDASNHGGEAAPHVTNSAPRCISHCDRRPPRCNLGAAQRQPS